MLFFSYQGIKLKPTKCPTMQPRKPDCLPIKKIITYKPIAKAHRPLQNSGTDYFALLNS